MQQGAPKSNHIISCIRDACDVSMKSGTKALQYDNFIWVAGLDIVCREPEELTRTCVSTEMWGDIYQSHLFRDV